jgi:hypothetical protein
MLPANLNLGPIGHLNPDGGRGRNLFPHDAPHGVFVDPGGRHQCGQCGRQRRRWILRASAGGPDARRERLNQDGLAGPGNRHAGGEVAFAGLGAEVLNGQCGEVHGWVG